MKKLKAFLKRIFSTFTVHMSQRPVLMTVLILLGINFAFLVFAAGIAWVIEPGAYQNYFFAFAAVLRWLSA